FHGACLVTSFQVLPSGELHTSRGGAAKESNQPPRIQSWSRKTTSPLESRGCQPALSVTLTQSGPRSPPKAAARNRKEAESTTTDHFMMQVPLQARLRRRLPSGHCFACGLALVILSPYTESWEQATMEPSTLASAVAMAVFLACSVSTVRSEQ